MEVRSPSWEKELWSCISGDGRRACPLYDTCEANHCSKQCFDDYTRERGKVYDTIRYGSDIDDLGVSHSTTQRFFPEHWAPGRIFQLLEMLASSYLHKSSITQPPVPTEFIKYFSVSPPIEVRPLSLKAYHGAVWRVKDKWVIYLNVKDEPFRQRLTLFHEVFHIIAHSKVSPVLVERGISRGFFKEMLADYFAGCILMPRDLLKEKLADVNDHKRLAEIFGVPEFAMWIRLKRTGLI